MKYNISQNSMVFGEISPTLYGQRQIDQYQGGLKQLKNFIVRPQGGVTRREGTIWQVDLPQTTAAPALAQTHTYRAVPYSFTDFNGVNRQVILTFQHGFVSAWEENIRGELEPARFQRYDPNGTNNISPQNDPLWINTSFQTSASATPVDWNELDPTGPRILPLSGTDFMLGFQYPDPGDGTYIQPSWQYGNIDTIPFGHGSGPFYIPNAADLGGIARDGTVIDGAYLTANHIAQASDWGLVVPDPDNIGSTIAGRGPFWLVVTGAAPNLAQNTDTDPGGTGTVVLPHAATSSQITESRAPCYIGLSYRPIHPGQTALYPSPFSSPFKVGGSAGVGIDLCDDHADWRLPLLPWNKIGDMTNNENVVEEGQWFRDFRESYVDTDGNIEVGTPQYGSAGWLQNLRYEQDHNVLWVTISESVVARFEYRAWDSVYGMSQGIPLPNDVTGSQRIVNDITMSLHQFGTAGPFRYDSADIITIKGTPQTAVSAAVLQKAGEGISLSSVVDQDGQDQINDTSRLGGSGVSSGTDELGPGGQDNMLYMAMDPASDVDWTADGTLYGGGPSAPGHQRWSNEVIACIGFSVNAYAGGWAWFGGVLSPNNNGLAPNCSNVWQGGLWPTLQLLESLNTDDYGDAEGLTYLWPQKSRNPGYWSKNTVSHTNTSGWRIQFGNSKALDGNPEPGFGDMIDRARAGHLFGSTGGPANAAAEINDPHRFQVDSSGAAAPAGGWTGVVIQMTCSLSEGRGIFGDRATGPEVTDTPYPSQSVPGGGVTVTGPIEGVLCCPNDVGGGSDIAYSALPALGSFPSSPTLTSLGGITAWGGNWVDVGEIDIQEVEDILPTHTTNGATTGDKVTYGISSFGYFDLSVSDCFSAGKTELEVGQTYHLWWRIKPVGNYPVPDSRPLSRGSDELGFGEFGPGNFGPDNRSYYYATASGLPYLQKTVASEGGYGGVLLSMNDGEGGVDWPLAVNNPFPVDGATSTRRGLNWMHHVWNPLGDPTDRGSMIHRPFNEVASQTPETPGYAKYAAWDSPFGRGLNRSNNLVTHITRFENRLIVSGGLDPRTAHWSSVSSINEPNWLPFTSQGLTIDDVAQSMAFRLELGGIQTGITNLFNIEKDVFIAVSNRLYKISAVKDGPISGINFVVNPISDMGANEVQVALSEDTAIYVSTDGRRLNRLTFGGQDEGYHLDSPSIYSEHLFENEIQRITSQPDPIGLLWVLNNDYTLKSMTLNRRQLVQGAAQHELGSNPLGSEVIDVVSFASTTGVWKTALLVKRTVYDVPTGDPPRASELTVASISLETFTQSMKINPDPDGWNYLDRSVKKEFNPGTLAVEAGTFPNLQSDTVSVLADGTHYDEMTIDQDGGIDDPPWLRVVGPFASVSNANPAVVTFANHGYDKGNNIYIGYMAGMLEIDQQYFKVGNTTVDTFELEGVNSSVVTLSGTPNVDDSNITFPAGGVSTISDKSQVSVRGTGLDASTFVQEIVSDTEIIITPPSSIGTGPNDYEIGYHAHTPNTGVASRVATNVTVGFPYESRIETLPQDISLQGGGSTDMSLRRPYEVVAKVESSAGGTAGAIGSTAQDFIYPDKDMRSQDADIRIPIESDDDTDGSIFISTNTSQKLEISQIVTRTDYKARGGNE